MIVESIPELLEGVAARWPERPLLAGELAPVSYADFLLGVNGLAGLLADGSNGSNGSNAAVRRGDHVAAVLPNSPELLYLWLALARLGAVLVPINPALPFAEVEPLLRQVGIAGLVSDAATLASYGERLDLRFRMAVGETAPGSLSFSTPAVSDGPLRSGVAGDPSTLLLTSGTTGRAKGAILTQASYTCPAREFGRWMEVVPEDRFLGCLPLFHLAGQAFAMAAIANGASLVLVQKFSGREFWSQVRRHGITVVRYLGEMLAVLLEQPESADDRQHALRAVYGGGARPDHAERFTARFGTAVVEGYGLTETNTVLRNEIGARRRGSLGRPTPYCEVRIASASQAAPGERAIGEIQVRRNPVMMTGYVGEPELSSSCFEGDWFKTGDLGYCDDDGYFFFVGRTKEIIRRRGENIVPAQVEEVLDRFPGVACSAVVGVPGELGGEEAKAFVVCRDGCRIELNDLIQWCRDWLADFQIPRYFEVCSDLPRTSTNKINRGELRKSGSLGGACFDRAQAPAPEAPLPAPLGPDAGMDPGPPEPLLGAELAP